MWILLSAVATASLVGSLHCVGMCGPLALWAAGADQKRSPASMFGATTFYHGGRLTTYALAGVIAGLVGNALDWSGDFVGIQLLAARIVGISMIAIGLWTILRLGMARWRVNQEPVSEIENYRPPKPSFVSGLFLQLRPYVFGLPLHARGLATGLLTPLLPCGWLYLFALLAAGTGSAVNGGLLMIAFWLGSVPAMVSLVASTRLLKSRARQIVPWIASILLIIAGTYTASGRGVADLNGKWKVSSSLVNKLQDGHSVNSLDAREIEIGIEQLVATPLPCCQESTDVDQSPTLVHKVVEGVP